jgi:hypothetical protein
LKTCRVPADIVLPIIRNYLDTYETYGLGTNPQKGYSPARILAEKAGLNPDTMEKYLLGRTRDISFYVIDRLLCAMDEPMRWYEWPLLPYYLAADLSEPPPGYRVCARDGCDNEFQATERGRKFCTRTCGSADAHGYTKRDAVCRNNHPRTPENIQWRRKKTTGRLYRTCVLCMGERQSERKARGYQRVAA